MIEITFRIPNALAMALAPMVARKAKDLEAAPKVQVALEARGLTTVEELTPAQQLKLVVRMDRQSPVSIQERVRQLRVADSEVEWTDWRKVTKGWYHKRIKEWKAGKF